VRPGPRTPRLPERLGRLGTWRPVAPAAERLAFFPGVTGAAATGRRATARAGAAYEAGQTAAVEPIARELPPAPFGPRVPWLSVDGARVPGPHQEGAEGKPLALGTGGIPGQARGEWGVPPAPRSALSPLATAAPFGRLALGATHRRGTETAPTVGAVSAGAEWLPGCVDRPRPAAGRLLDVPPALSSVAQAGQAGYGERPTAFTRWVARQRPT
jgi:hypothetical protein